MSSNLARLQFPRLQRRNNTTHGTILRVKWDEEFESANDTTGAQRLQDQRGIQTNVLPCCFPRILRREGHLKHPKLPIHKKGAGGKGKPLKEAISGQGNCNCHLLFACFLSMSVTSQLQEHCLQPAGQGCWQAEGITGRAKAPSPLSRTQQAVTAQLGITHLSFSLPTPFSSRAENTSSAFAQPIEGSNKRVLAR